MSRSARFFDIIQLLRQAETPLVARDLAEKLEVNVRTIYRDIASLQASGVPINGEAGIGYVMQSGYDLPPLMFTRDELEAISVGLSLLGRSGDRGLMEAAGGVAAKISDVSADQNTLRNALHVSTWNQIPTSARLPERLREIIHNAQELEILYRDLKGKKTKRVIKPIALFYYIDAILVVAWCTLREGFRHFRIDRIENWEPTGKSFSSEAQQLRIEWEKLQSE
ncbi:MAG: YafY family protein [Rhizobiaceae bacterium]|nr:YafY family protein [Rhizobiaceae bacterium]